MDEENSKVGMVDQIAIAVSSPKSYKQLTKLKTGKTVAFMILIAFLLVFIEFGINVITFLVHVGGLDNLINNKMTSFTYENGKLEAENEMALDIGEMIIYINTDYDEISIEDMDSDGLYLAFGAENVVMGIVSGTSSYEYTSMDLSDLLVDGFDNEMLTSMIPVFYISLGLVYIFNMIGKLIEMMFYALIFSIIGRALSKSVNTGLSYGNVLRVCIYAQTLGMLLVSVNTCAGYLVPYTLMYIIYFIIAFIFMSRGIGSHAKNPEAPPDDWV